LRRKQQLWASPTTAGRRWRAISKVFCYNLLLQTHLLNGFNFFMKPSENTQKNLQTLLRQYPRGHVVAATSLIVGLGLLLVLPASEGTTDNRKSEPVTLELQQSFSAPIESPSEEAQTEQQVADPLQAFLYEQEQPEPAEPELTLETFTIKSGDSLSRLFNRAGLSDRDLYQLMNEASEARALQRIMPGQEITFALDEDGKLQELIYQRNRLSSMMFSREDGVFAAQELEREPDVQIAYRRATIDSSLFMAGQRAGITDNLTMSLAGIFGWDIDFIMDIRRGDTFSILYEEHFLDGEKIGNGNILAAQFTNRGRTLDAVRYVDANGEANFFTPDGTSMRRAFLRTPVEFTRISSPFNPNRRHPVLNTIRAHKGTDYAAPRGTPIKAAGDGRITHAGRKGGYGNTVIIQHGQTYQTLYAHLHNFHRNTRSGARVRQGQVIGYVGSTGLATGPHLHYEFHVNGQVRNPETVELPKAESVPSSEMARFKSQTQPIMAQMKRYQEETQLALVNDELNLN